MAETLSSERICLSNPGMSSLPAPAGAPLTTKPILYGIRSIAKSLIHG